MLNDLPHVDSAVQRQTVVLHQTLQPNTLQMKKLGPLLWVTYEELYQSSATPKKPTKQRLFGSLNSKLTFLELFSESFHFSTQLLDPYSANSKGHLSQFVGFSVPLSLGKIMTSSAPNPGRVPASYLDKLLKGLSDIRGVDFLQFLVVQFCQDCVPCQRVGTQAAAPHHGVQSVHQPHQRHQHAHQHPQSHLVNKPENINGVKHLFSQASQVQTKK